MSRAVVFNVGPLRIYAPQDRNEKRVVFVSYRDQLLAKSFDCDAELLAQLQQEVDNGKPSG